MQLQTTLAVVIASIPAYKVFMDRAASGLMSISFQGREGTYQLSSIIKANDSKQASREADDLSTRRANGYHAKISANDVHSNQIDRAPRRTVEWDVRHSDEVRLNPRGERQTSQDDHAEQSATRTQRSTSLLGMS